MDLWFERLTEQTSLTRDQNSIKNSIQRLVIEAGFCAFSYLGLRGNAQFAISSYPAAWQQRYFDQSYSLIDPVVSTAKKIKQAFAWPNSTCARMTDEHRHFYREAGDFGIKSGVSIPVRTGFGHVTIFTMASAEIGFAEKQRFDPVVAAAAVGQIHSRIDFMRVMPTQRSNLKLNTNELTCLRWCAEGKSLKVIAAIEDTSYANVRFFLGNAKKALGATTLPQATAIAKDLGLI